MKGAVRFRGMNNDSRRAEVDELCCAQVPPRLPVRPRPIPGELTHGYLVRVTAANGYEAPHSLWRALLNRGCSGEAVFEMALQLSRLQRDALFGVFPRYCRINLAPPCGLSPEDFHHERMRWCPRCLAEAPYLRAEWGLKLCCVCVRHAQVLRDRCPACQALQRLERTDVARCSCGCDLSKGSTPRADASLLRLQEMLITAPYEGERNSFPYISPRAWLRIIRYLGQFGGSGLPVHPGKVAGMHELEVALGLVAGTAALLEGWPSHFYTRLADLRAAFPLATSINEAFGTLYQVLYKDLDEPCYQFLRDAFETYLREHWFGLLGRRNRRLSPSTVAEHPRKPLHTIAQKAGAAESIVRHLAATGTIRGNAFRYESGRTTWSVPDEETLCVTACVADRITVLEAATRLGISRPRVHELIDSGLLDVRIRRTDCRAATWLLSRSSVERLARLASSADATEEPARPHIQLSKLLRTWKLQTGEFPAMVTAIASGKLRPRSQTKPHGGLGTLVLPVDDVHEWLRTRRIDADAWLSIDAAGKLLGVKQQVAYELVARGMLAANATDNGSASQHRVHRVAIDAFRRTYVPLAEIAKAHGTSPRRMLDLVSATPVCGPNVDGARQYFYRRADVEPQVDIEVAATPVRPKGESR